MQIPSNNSLDAYELLIVAENKGNFLDFSPYVPAINDQGAVVFQARQKNQETGIFYWNNEQGSSLVTSSTHSPYSHPDLNNSGTLCFYGLDEANKQVVSIVTSDRKTHILSNFLSIGPLGPTINNLGYVGFRAKKKDCDGIYLALSKKIITVAETSAEFISFEGLPVVNSRGDLLYRANTKGGHEEILLYTNGSSTIIASTKETFRSLGRFPTMNDHGVVIFQGILKDGVSGIFEFQQGVTTKRISQSHGFENFRGALINNKNDCVFFASKPNLGIYQEQNGKCEKIIGIGDHLFNSHIKEFALNSVSINENGEFVLRIEMQNHQQFILLISPKARQSFI